MIKITFPDGSVREYNEGVNGLQIAESISSRLAQDVLACGVNGEIYDLGRPINEDASVVLYKWEDEQGKHAFWHTSAHLLAEALQELYPGIQFGIGPAIENGFYYDVDPGEAIIKEADRSSSIKRTTGNSERSISSDPSEDALSATHISIPSPTELSITEGINLRSISTPFQFNITTDTLFISFQTKTPFNAVPSSLKPPILTRIN